jgi:DNA excision repair protein ERCC-2
MSYTVAVRALCEFTAKCGDLDLRFTPSPSAQEGIAGHAEVQSRRASGYQSEVSLTGEYQHLHVRGRADGYDPVRNQIEEIKTFRGDFKAIPDNHRQLHWAQAKVYGWLMCQKLDKKEMRVALVYYDIGKKTETVLSDLYSADDLQLYFETICSRFLAWAEQEEQHRSARDQALRSLTFPHGAFRQGQRALAEAVYKSATAGCCLMAQASTGIGKTIGTLFPLLKASPVQALDKIFYLAAKTSGRQLAIDAVERIKRSAPELPLRMLELIARDKACEHPDKACHGESCPLAKGFYDRLPAARSAALQVDVLDKESIRNVALEHDNCPYYLSQELVRWSDVVIGDYNYYFDGSAMLYGLTTTNQWRVGVLVDEAHNMIERARKMYSAELDQSDLKFLRKNGPPALKGTLDRLNRSWNAIHQEQTSPYQSYAAIPDAFLNSLQQTIGTITDYLADNPVQVDAALQHFYFDILHFSNMAESYGEHSLFDITKTAQGGSSAKRPGAVLCIRNIIPAPFLKQRFETAHAVTLFSATLSPWQFYSDTLGLPDNTPWIEVQSPFRAEQLSVQVVQQVSTRYRDRENSLSPIVDIMARQFEQCPGNYLAFFSSFEYMHAVSDLFAVRYPNIPAWSQMRGMEEHEKEQFLQRFTTDGQGIGFAVLGGAFSEGVDLPGRRLIGAFIATLGLPQINPVNEQMKARLSATFGAGYEYAYLYPGLQKVVQAAGRVIRTESDQGVVFLIDDRFARSDVRALLPGWWDVKLRNVDRT